MKFSIIANPVNAYKFAVTIDGIHSGVEEIPTLTQAMHLTLADLKSAVSKTSGAITGNLVAPISPEIELWGAGVTYLRSRDARKEESGVKQIAQNFSLNQMRFAPVELIHPLVFVMTQMPQFQNQKLRYI